MKIYNLRTGFSILCCILFANTMASSRDAFTINSNWKFRKGEITINSPLFNDPAWELVNIPHTWNLTDILDDTKGYYRGIGWYYKSIHLDNKLKGKRVYLHFEGANQIAEVFINGSPVGRHKGGYTAFTFDITDQLIFDNNSSKTENEIAIKLDNSHNANIPPLSADFTFYGGIYRDIWIIPTENIHFDMLNAGSKGIFIQTPTVTESKASIRIYGKINNDSKTDQSIIIKSNLVDEKLNLLKTIQSSVKIKAGASFSFDVSDKNISGYKLWSPDSPAMYKVISQICDAKTGLVIDEVINPLAFRWYSFDANNGFYLNGKHLKLIGVNRHQDHQGHGNALPDNLHRKDIKLIKEMGSNFIRIAHYPQDMSLLDACDELGLLASIEIPNVNSITESSEYHENAKTMMIEMVRQYYNHPSIIIWTLMNEIRLREPEWTGAKRNPTTKEQYEKQLAEYNLNLNTLANSLHTIAKTEDPYRYTMIAHHGDFEKYQTAGLNTITDIVGWNLYYGWYRAELKGLDEFISNFRSQLPNKPIIISEYGVGSDTRIRTNNPSRFDNSIEYADIYHSYYLDYILKNDAIAGASLWNFADFSSEGRKDQMPNINNKGMVTWNRDPKDVYYFYQASLLEKPLLKIAPVQYSNRSAIQDSGLSTSTQKIWIYSNQTEVELFLNGTSLGKQTIVNKKGYFNVPFVDGKNILEAKSIVESKVITDFQIVNFNLIPFNTSSNLDTFKDIHINAGAHFSFTDDYSINWLPDQPYNEKNFGFIGGYSYKRWENSVIGSEKPIYGTLNEPLYQTQRINPESFKANVPNGIYEIELHFCELLNAKELQATLYNLGAETKESKLNQRVFSVEINGKTVINSLNLSKEYGEQWSVSQKFITEITKQEGLTIKFIPIEGEPVINGISIIKK